MLLGVDLSMLDELSSLNPVYRYDGIEVEPFDFFANRCKTKMTRIRLWHNPYDDNARPYGGGTNDFNCFLRLAKKANAFGMSVLLDFHYSDFWVDPGRQKLPKAWANLSYAQLIDTIYGYTKSVLEEAKANDIDIGAIQVGNEITNGMLHPFGDVWKEFDPALGGGFEGHVALLSSAIRACREIYPSAKIVIHLEHSGSPEIQIPYIERIVSMCLDFDVIGESYYPYWHGGFDCFENNITQLIERFGKEVWVVEMGYEYMTSKVPGHHCELHDPDNPDFQVGNIHGRIPFEGSKEGQANYLKTFLALCKRIGIGLVCYWEPCWIQMEVGWAKEAGQIYCGLVPSKAYNDWSNECLFDEDGNANPAVDVFTQDYVDSI